MYPDMYLAGKDEEIKAWKAAIHKKTEQIHEVCGRLGNNSIIKGMSCWKMFIVP